MPPSHRLKRALFALFLALERLGVHVLPRHFYSSVADRGWLTRNPSLWRRPTVPAGTDWDLDAQLGWLSGVCGDHLHEVAGFRFLGSLSAREISFRYGLVEGQVLHCAIRALAPEVVVEVGSGASTALIADAAAQNAADGRTAARISSIDPHPPAALERLPRVELVAVPAQAVPSQVFAQLHAGDLLFIDSTHVLKSGSELPRLYLEVLPALRPGVLVHIHDIYLPYLHSPWVLSDFWDWQETALLGALLTHNSRLEVLCCQSALHHAMPERLREVLPDYRPRRMAAGLDDTLGGGHFPSSIWLRTR